MCNMFPLLFVLHWILYVFCSKDVTLIRDIRNNRKSSEDDLRTNKIMQELLDTCIDGNQRLTVEKLKKETQTILDNIEAYKDVVKLNTQLRKEIKWIIQESKGESETRRILDLLKQDTKGTCSQPITKYKDCTELKNKTENKLDDGVYKIYPGGDKSVQAYCDMTTDGGGWTVMLKRFGGSVRFNRTWVEHENGFGDVNGEFWLGDAASKYKLTVGGYSGTAADWLGYHNMMKFSTVDQDNDRYKTSCAVRFSGSWWYNACSHSDLTKLNPRWGYGVTKPVMMIRQI